MNDTTKAGGGGTASPSGPPTLTPPSVAPPRVASKVVCKVTVPGTPSAWPGWDELATLAGPEVTHAVDGSGAIYLAEWKDGFAVRRDRGGAWEELDPLRVDAGPWAFAVDPTGRVLLAHTVGGSPAPSVASVAVQLEAWSPGGWTALGAPLLAETIPVGTFPFSAQTAGQPALAADGAGGAVLMFDDRSGSGPGGQTAYRWDLAAATWTRLGSPAFLPTQWAAHESAIEPAGGSRLFAMSTWGARVDDNIGCYDDGLHVASFDGSSWTDLGELKLDRNHSPDSGCPSSFLPHASLAVDGDGGAWIARTEQLESDYLAGRNTGTVYLSRWTDKGWEPQVVFGGVSPGARIAVSAVDGGQQFLSFTVPDGAGSKLVLYRRQGTDWVGFYALDSPAPDLEGSVVCADEAGNPIIAVTDAQGGHLLRFDPSTLPPTFVRP